MLRLNFNDIGIGFSVNMDGQDILFREWGATDDCIYYQPLSALVDNGQAKFYKSEWRNRQTLWGRVYGR